MIRTVAVIGASGMLGRPVANELAGAGYNVSEPTRKTGTDVFDAGSLRKAFRGQDAVYVNLSVKHDERPTDPHAETDGLRNVIAAARDTGVRRLMMISSLVMNYQGMNGFQWWAFDVKKEAVRLMKSAGIPSTIFYPSTFMENFPQQRQGNKIMLAGKSKYPMWLIAGSDYGRQVARSLSFDDDVSREYAAQGLEPWTYQDGARVFVENYPHERLQLSNAPLPMLKGIGLFSRKMRYIANIVEALDNYPEKFQSEKTWQELGKPEVTLKEFASRQPPP